MEKILHTQYGSYVYGTNVPSSDHDYKVIYLPEPRSIIMGTVRDAYNESTKKDMSAKNTQDDYETEYFSFKKYMNLLVDGQTVAVDLLFTPKEFWIEKPSDIWNQIKDNKDKFLHSGVSAYVGYCRSQANKYSVKGSRVKAVRDAKEFISDIVSKHGLNIKLNDVWPEIEDFVTETNSEHIAIVNETMRGNDDCKLNMLEVCNRKVQSGAKIKEALNLFTKIYEEYGHRAKLAESASGNDWKALLHAVRVAKEAEELLLTGNITFPRPEKDLLLKIRKGEVHYQKVADIIEQCLLDVESAQEKSILPKTYDKEFFDEFCYAIYKDHIKRGI